jgi:hypothetical protein
MGGNDVCLLYWHGIAFLVAQEICFLCFAKLEADVICLPPRIDVTGGANHGKKDERYVSRGNLQPGSLG